MKTKEELLKIYSSYLPYKLYGRENGKETNDKLLGIYGTDGHTLTLCFRLNDHNSVDYECQIEDFKPILYSMDYLTKEIEHKGERFVPMDELTNGDTVQFNFSDFAADWNKRDTYTFDKYVEDWVLGSQHCFDFLPYGFIQKLIEWHFNVFGLSDSEYIKKETLIQ